MFHTMWNREFPGTESELTDWAVSALGERLPTSWRLGKTQRRERGKKRGPDAVMRLRGPDGTSAEIILEVKKRVEPKDVLEVVAKARQSSGGRTTWIVAPFLSPRTRERLREEQTGYADATGNMWLALEKPALFIETTGAEKDPQPVNRSLTSLKGRAAGRVVRALCDYKPPYGVRELAQRSNTALSSISRVVALLAREAVVVKNSKGGITDVDIETLIRRWTQDYSLLKSNRSQTFLEPRTLRALTEKLKDYKGMYAATGSLAAVIKVSVAVPHLAVIYVDDVPAAASSLGLKPTVAGANVILARPFDPVVYERGAVLDGVRYAAMSQVAADLLTSPGRGPSGGEALIEWMKENPDGWRG